MRRWLFLFALLSCALYIGLRASQGRAFESDLMQLLPPAQHDALQQKAATHMRDAVVAHTVWLFGHRDATQARKAAFIFADEIRAANVFAEVRAKIPAPDPGVIAALYHDHAAVLANADRQALLQNDSTYFSRALAQQWFSPLSLSLPGDSFGNRARFLNERLAANGNLRWQDGALQVQTKDMTYVLVDARASVSAFDNEFQSRALPLIASAEQHAHDQVQDLDVVSTGLLRFAADAGARTANEIGVLSTVEMALVLLLLVLSLRRLYSVGLMFLVISSALLGATALSLLIYERVHLITFVFGTTLIGIAGDYALHFLVLHAASAKQRNDAQTEALVASKPAWDSRAAMRVLRGPLTVALGTTLLAYLAIAVTPFAGFRQMAVFCMLGLICAYLSVLFALPDLLQRPAQKPPRGLNSIALALAWVETRAISHKQLVLGIALLLLLAIPGWWQLRSDDDIHLLQTPQPELLRAQQRVRELIGVQQDAQFFLIRGEDAEQVLQREELLRTQLDAAITHDELRGYRAVSLWLPSAKMQTENAQLLQHALTQDGVIGQASLALSGEIPALVEQSIVLTPEQFFAHPLSATVSGQWLGRQSVAGQTQSPYASIVLLEGLQKRSAMANLRSDGAQFVDEPAAVSALFHDFRQQASGLVFVAYLIVFGLLIRSRGVSAAVLLLTPTLLSSSLTLAVLGYSGAPINLFHSIGLLLVLGIGVDYALFLTESEGHAPASLLAIVLSACTALFAFGLLMFSSMPAIAGFGFTVMVGVLLSLLFAPLVLLWRAAKPIVPTVK